ncbi:general transcription factor IIF subunit 1 [Phlebotomus argentipes]|uniref:general transcription factor IIF subunit 1 n=1 Tax=Phlebotomus argentipes TaxID=94469 RepID=UPI002892F57A|nr:general transcription factor IIF subunit 1 [Phlebotomus argentipes]
MNSATSSSGSSSSATNPVANVQEFVIRVPKNMKKKHHVMRFNATLNVDFAQWKMVKMERENNAKDFRGIDEDLPKFGAGSEYNRELKEEVRRKKFGIISKKYKPEAQPWILKVDKSGKKFKGIREGGVGENAAFYVFTHAPDKAIEAYPLHEWYNFQPIQRYKALSAEEAEQEFGRRKKVMNFFSLMLRKRLKGDDDEGEDPEEKKANRKKGKDLKISDMDEWIDSSDESDSDSSEEKKEKEEDSDKEKNAKKKGKKEELQKKKKKKKDVDDEAFEESDDGDEEGRELDYISDSSDSDSDHEGKIDKDMKGVAEEDALRKLLTSEEESENEEKKSGEESDKEEDEKKSKEKGGKDGKDARKKKLKKRSKDDKKESSSETSSDSSDSDDEAAKKSAKKNKDKDQSSSSKASRNSAQAESNKRKASSLPSDLSTPENSCSSPVNTPGKKPKLDTPSLPATFAGVVASNKEDCGITEEDVRRYLMRKPMTTIELLTKFKNKKTGVSSDRLVETMTQILKKINPVKQTIQGKMYLSIKVNK